MGGLFITLEGGEGAGKSTQLAMLAETLAGRNYNVLQTREPGGTDGAEAIRSLVVSGSADRWSAMTELLLLMAARRDHVEKKIQPHLNAEGTVICDRFVHSTLAYQAGREGISEDAVWRFHDQATDGLRPDITFFLDLPPERAVSRLLKRDGSGQGRFEKKGLAFHRQVHRAFAQMAQTDKSVYRIDADRPPEDIHRDMLNILDGDRT